MTHFPCAIVLLALYGVAAAVAQAQGPDLASLPIPLEAEGLRAITSLSLPIAERNCAVWDARGAQ
jgi:hypothetical protein